MDNPLLPLMMIPLVVLAFCLGFRAYMDGWFNNES